MGLATFFGLALRKSKPVGLDAYKWEGCEEKLVGGRSRWIGRALYHSDPHILLLFRQAKCVGRPLNSIWIRLFIKSMDKALLDKLKVLLEGELPGPVAQFAMAHVSRPNGKPAPENAPNAAVLILLFPKNGKWHIAFTQRASKYAHDKHKGQMSFPGGKMEETDIDHVAAALRETEEEIGVPRTEIKPLGLLTQMYIPVSNFVVQPVVGYVEHEPSFVLEENEVAELVSESVERLCSDELKLVKDLAISKQMTLKRVPYFDVEGKVVWGATAMMLNEFVILIRE